MMFLTTNDIIKVIKDFLTSFNHKKTIEAKQTKNISYKFDERNVYTVIYI